jgi:hypothetical protein
MKSPLTWTLGGEMDEVLRLVVPALIGASVSLFVFWRQNTRTIKVLVRQQRSVTYLLLIESIVTLDESIDELYNAYRSFQSNRQAEAITEAQSRLRHFKAVASQVDVVGTNAVRDAVKVYNFFALSIVDQFGIRLKFETPKYVIDYQEYRSHSGAMMHRIGESIRNEIGGEEARVINPSARELAEWFSGYTSPQESD